MNSYFTLRPCGEGTAEIEQFHSYFYRFAAIHSTTMIPMAKHLEEWWSNTYHERVALNDVFLYKANRIALCGYGDAVASYLKVVSEASHQPQLYRTTLLPIRDAADANTHRAIRRGRAWCPACMYWAVKNNETYYDRLIWALSVIERCPVHHVRLTNRCPNCHAVQLAYHASAGMHRCAKCLKSLAQKPNTWKRAENPSFGEQDCTSLIAAISDGSLQASVPRAFGVFTEEARAIAAPILAYRHTYQGGPRSWRLKQHRPTFPTMLRRCQESGVRLVDVLSDPRGAAHVAGSLIFDEYGIPKERRPRHDPKLHQAARKRLLDAIAGLPTCPLISFKEFANELGVSTGYLRYREPALSKVYIAEHARQVTCENRRKKRQAKIELTLGGALLRYLNGGFRSQDELVDHLHAHFAVQKHVARLLVSQSLSIHAKAKALSEKSSLSHTERTMLRRRRDAGYI